MFDHDYRDLNHDGKVDGFERWNDWDDFQRMTNESKKYSNIKPKKIQGFRQKVKWANGSDWLMAILIAFLFPMPISVILLVVIAVVFLVFAR